MLAFAVYLRASPIAGVTAAGQPSLRVIPAQLRLNGGNRMPSNAEVPRFLALRPVGKKP